MSERRKQKKGCRFCGRGPHWIPAEMCEGAFEALLDAFRAASELATKKAQRRKG